MTQYQWIIAGDHAATELKDELSDYLTQKGETFLDVTGENTPDDDYPDFADKLVKAMREHDGAQGILLCGSGIGISIRANRYPDMRAALVQSPAEAKTARQHNDANIICFGERVVDTQAAKDSLDVFASESFEGGRHQRRVEKLTSDIKE